MNTTSRPHTWLTSVLRPAGNLDPPQVKRLAAALEAVAASSDMVILDLAAATVPRPAQLAAALRAPARQLDQPGRGVLLICAVPEVVRALARIGVRAATVSPAA